MGGDEESTPTPAAPETPPTPGDEELEPIPLTPMATGGTVTYITTNNAVVPSIPADNTQIQYEVHTFSNLAGPSIATA
jgi:hypothetical protein